MLIGGDCVLQFTSCKTIHCYLSLNSVAAGANQHKYVHGVLANTGTLSIDVSCVCFMLTLIRSKGK